MSLDTFNVMKPSQTLQSTNPADPYGNIIKEYETTLNTAVRQRAVLSGFFPVHHLDGTNSVQSFAIGRSKLGVVVPGVTPNGTNSDIGKKTMVVEKRLYARTTLAEQERFITKLNVRQAIMTEQATVMARCWDEAICIQAMKASLATAGKYGLSEFKGGTTVTVTDPQDPAAILAAVGNLLAALENKDINAQLDGMIAITSPSTFWTLMQAEQIVNQNYITADGTTLTGIPTFKLWGIPVVHTSAYIGGRVIDGTDTDAHPSSLLNTALNNNAFNGDFSKFVLTLVSPRALMVAANETVTSRMFFDPVSVSDYIDSFTMFGVDVDRPEYAGSVLTA